MRTVQLADITLGAAPEGEHGFTFRKKLEAARILDRLGVSVMLGQLRNVTADVLLVKSLAGELENVTLAAGVPFEEEGIRGLWNALKDAKHPRLQICAAVSTARMEYVYHKKAAAMLEAVKTALTVCRSLCPDAEFIAEDATRADPDFLCTAIRTAIAAGATTVTVCDTAGTLLPEEFGAFIQMLYDRVEELRTVTLGVCCSDALHVADASAVTAIAAGAGEVKVTSLYGDSASLGGMSKLLTAKSEALQVRFGLETSDIGVQLQALRRLGSTAGETRSPFENGVRRYSDGTVYTAADDAEEIAKAARQLGCELDEKDLLLVYAAFRKAAERKEKVTPAELDSIIASVAMQVPAAYTLENYVVTTGNAIDILAHIKLKRDGQIFDGLSIGDGPIDAAFLAIENITGHHYELDDFQIRTVSEGREAMGQTVVKLRSGGKLYSGIGTSTDIIGSGVAAYINALNKIVYEEENQ